MAILVLITLGAAIGWLASILVRQDSVGQSFSNIAAGAIGAIASFAVAGKSFDSATLDPESLALGVVGAAILVAIVAVFRRQIVR